MRDSIRLVLFINLLSCSVAIASDPLKEADSLIAARKYQSAIEVLNAVKGGNQDPSIVILKVDIALKYFAQSIMHRIFAFKDLDPSEDLHEVRLSPGKLLAYPFAIDSVLTRLITKYPKDARLYARLGDFYWEVSSKYGGTWLLPDSEVAARTATNYRAAAKLGSLHPEGFHRLAVVSLDKGKYQEAIGYLNRALILKPDYADAHYNLAYAYTQTKNHSRALPHAQRAVEMYDDPELKSDAARLAAVCLMGEKRFQEALAYLYRADTILPHQYPNLRNIMWAYLHYGPDDSLAASTLKLFRLAPENPEICQVILADYAEAGKSAAIPATFTSIARRFSRSPEALGNLYFHLASFYQDQTYTASARAFFDSAQVNFRLCMPDTHYVFRVIGQRLKQLDDK